MEPRVFRWSPGSLDPGSPYLSSGFGVFAVLGRIRLAGNTGVGLLMVDQELASGTVPGAPAEPAAGGAA